MNGRQKKDIEFDDVYWERLRLQNEEDRLQFETEQKSKNVIWLICDEDINRLARKGNLIINDSMIIIS